jgi:hypothetical protein
MIMRAIWTRLAPGIATLALALASGSVSAQFSSITCSPSGDFVTGGGFIIPNLLTPAHANFGVGGGCKNGLLWGHLEYIDHGADLKVHGTSITGYQFVSDGTDSHGRPVGTRLICGTARTNQSYGDVDFFVRVRDAGEPGTMDEFDITLSQGTVVPYSTFTMPVSPHKLNNGEGGGGNIQLHTLNPSTTPFGDCEGAAG